MDIFIKGDSGNSNVDVNFTDSGVVHAAPWYGSESGIGFK